MRLLALLLLLPTLAFSQGLTTLAPGATGGGKVLASFPLVTSGPLITEDANTVAHVYWNGTALVDTKGNAWTQNGTVPQVSANPFTTTRYGAGPFSTANYYSLGTGADVLDFAGDFTACVVFVPSILGVQQYLVASGLYGATGAGWAMGLIATSNMPAFYTFGATSTYAITNSSAVPVFGGPNIFCGGRAGATQYAKINLTATASAAALNTPDAGRTAKIGNDGVLPGSLQNIYEVYATSTPFTEATVVAIQQKVLGHYDGSSALAVTRATNATYENPAGTVWTAAPGVARITGSGLLRERASTNYVLQSTTHAKAAAATGTLPTGTFVGRHAGTGTMTIANGTATTTGLSCTTVAAGTTCPFTVTVTGTMAITTTAGTTRAQIEPGTATDFTSWIDTTTTALTRNVDDISATVPSAPANWCIAGTFEPYSGTWPNALSLWTLGDTYTVANTATSWGNSSLYIVDAASGVKDLGDYTDPVAPWRVVTCNKGGALSLAVNGTMVDDSATGAGTGILTTPKTTLRFGSQTGGGTASTMFIKNVSLWKATKTKEVK